ncbi:MAG: nucleotide disphospho-sugar-binding domain-containing protein [Pseudomonadota bacterium]
MARILLGWELGANRGHIVRLLTLADALADQGHEVALALQDLSLMPRACFGSFTLYQAPLWPRLLASTARSYPREAQTMGDILYRLGLDDPLALAGLVAGWHTLFAAFRPQLVIGDFAPALGVAARGRMPVIQLGTGFTVPPSDMDHFPALSANEAVHDEAEALSRSNDGLKAIGEPALKALPAIFAADKQMPGEFARLDPYGAFRTGPLNPPSVAHPVPQPHDDGPGDEIFVYGFERAMTATSLWDGLQRSGLPVRVHIPRLSPAMARALTDRGFAYEPEPLPFADIARRSRIVLSHGGHGFTCSAMLAGLPQIVTYYDLEKRLTGERIAAMGTGGYVSLSALNAEALGQGVRQLYEAEAPQQKAREMAESFAVEMGKNPLAAIVGAAEQMLD